MRSLLISLLVVLLAATIQAGVFKKEKVKLGKKNCLCDFNIEIGDTCSGSVKCDKKCSGSGTVELGGCSFTLAVKKGKGKISKCSCEAATLPVPTEPTIGPGSGETPVPMTGSGSGETPVPMTGSGSGETPVPIPTSPGSGSGGEGMQCSCKCNCPDGSGECDCDCNCPMTSKTVTCAPGFSKVCPMMGDMCPQDMDPICPHNAISRMGGNAYEGMDKGCQCVPDFLLAMVMIQPTGRMEAVDRAMTKATIQVGKKKCKCSYEMNAENCKKSKIVCDKKCSGKESGVELADGDVMYMVDIAVKKGKVTIAKCDVEAPEPTGTGGGSTGSGSGNGESGMGGMVSRCACVSKGMGGSGPTVPTLPPTGSGSEPAPPTGSGSEPAPPTGSGSEPAPPTGSGSEPAPPTGSGSGSGPQTAPPGQTPCSTKRGVGLNPDTWSDASNPGFLCGDLTSLGPLNWWYDWGAVDIHGWGGDKYSCPGNKGPQGFMPILRKHEYTSAEALPEFESDVILGFNEPNHKSQDNISPEWTATEWIKIQARYPDKTLVSPCAAPCGGSGCNGGNTKDWFNSFFGNCTNLGGCRVDYLATHIYTCDADYTMAFLQDLYDTYGLKIWLTEFACPFERDVEKIKAYMANVIPMLEAADFVDKYAWFASRFSTQDYGAGWLLSGENSLLKENVAEKTSLGDLYMSFSTPNSPDCAFVTNPPTTPQPATCQDDKDYTDGEGLNWPTWLTAGNLEECDAQCAGWDGCTHFSWVGPTHADTGLRNSCWLKKGASATKDVSGTVSGPLGCSSL